jgi:CheY-like chemotaxis protein
MPSGRSCGTIARLARQTVLIVDDHAAFRQATTALLEAEGFRVVGEAADGEEDIRAVALLRPEVVLLDIQLPRVDGLEVAERLAARPAPPAIVLISSRSGDLLMATCIAWFLPNFNYLEPAIGVALCARIACSCPTPLLARRAWVARACSTLRCRLVSLDRRLSAVLSLALSAIRMDAHCLWPCRVDHLRFVVRRKQGSSSPGIPTIFAIGVWRGLSAGSGRARQVLSVSATLDPQDCQGQQR